MRVTTSASALSGLDARSGSNIDLAHADDIECIDWLREIGFSQYEETFLTNFSVGGQLLSRKRLAQIRLQDFPKMNIERYDHQKKLLEHIRHTLQFTFHSPVRRKEVRRKQGLPEDEPQIAEGKEGDTIVPANGAKGDGAPEKRHTKVDSRRRRSFDASAWNSISRLRTIDNSHKVAAEHLRAIRVGDVEVRKYYPFRHIKFHFSSL